MRDPLNPRDTAPSLDMGCPHAHLERRGRRRPAQRGGQRGSGGCAHAAVPRARRRVQHGAQQLRRLGRRQWLRQPQPDARAGAPLATRAAAAAAWRDS